MKEIKPSEFIADLYECRAAVGLRPQNFREMQDPQEILQYNWLNTIIAKLTDKYEVKQEDVSEALSLRKVSNHQNPN